MEGKSPIDFKNDVWSIFKINVLFKEAIIVYDLNFRPENIYYYPK